MIPTSDHRTTITKADHIRYLYRQGKTPAEIIEITGYLNATVGPVVRELIADDETEFWRYGFSLMRGVEE